MTIDDFTPINGRILLEVLLENSAYEGVIHRLDAGQEKSNLAIVKAVDSSYTGDIPLAIKVGDVVMFNKHSGTVWKLDRFNKDEPEYRIIKYEDIFGILRWQPS
jgi:co-chaperonin GroES (HSP10)